MSQQGGLAAFTSTESDGTYTRGADQSVAGGAGGAFAGAAPGTGLAKSAGVRLTTVCAVGALDMPLSSWSNGLTVFGLAMIRAVLLTGVLPALSHPTSWSAAMNRRRSCPHPTQWQEQTRLQASGLLRRSQSVWMKTPS